MANPDQILNTNRSLYKVRDPAKDNQLVAFVTGTNAQQVLQRYHTQGGQVQNPTVERVSYGYPQDELEVFA